MTLENVVTVLLGGYIWRGGSASLSSSIYRRRSFSSAKDSKSRVIDTRNCLTCLATGLFTPKLSSVRRSSKHRVADKPNGTSPSQQTRKAKLATSEVLMDILTG
ncbi:hypothetical protein APICC_01691 [Apis cerana cerana]|uniref:Uncharacterized protein n=1 Tax=Apis cerana cerana TaxID=94128 RepID=A0A2A3EM63_APICC|nr:hypothetical protein APICC_01691 [Apis cerana cerana]